MFSCSRILQRRWLLAGLGLWSLLAFCFVAPFGVHAAAIVPRDFGQHLTITVRNLTPNPMILKTSNVVGGTWGTKPTNVAPNSILKFDAQGTGNSANGVSGAAIWYYGVEPAAPRIRISWGQSYPDDKVFQGSGSSIESQPRGAAQFSSSIESTNSDVTETFTIRPKH